jgi:hypothetical protein
VSASGGSVTLTATVRNAKTCGWSSSPTIPGFAKTVKCKTGTVARSARFTANTSTTTKSYAVTLTVRGKTTTLDHWKVTQSGSTTTTTFTMPAPAAALANAFIGGNESPPLPTGPPGEVAVIASASLTQLIQPGGPDSLEIPIVVRNNTAKTQSGIEVTAIAQNGGVLVGTASSEGVLQPLVVPPGQIAIGDVFFQNLIPTTSTVSYTVTTGNPIYTWVNLLVTASNISTDQFGFSDLFGVVQNQTTSTVQAGALVYGICFDSSGQPTGDLNSGTDAGDMAPGSEQPFSGQISGENTPCVSWLITAVG